jgi:ADP-ribose pyrophosphatase YjhB (NUDIX family)
VGVGGVVIHRNRVLLVLRKREPLKGEWSLPGGLVELGEELSEAAQRELMEETGLNVEPLEIIAVFDRIMRVGKGAARVRYHFVIVDYACRWKGGRLKPSSDVADARWARREELPKYQLTPMATAVINETFKFFNARRRPQRIAVRPFASRKTTIGL